MQYTIENEYLRLTVDTHGAEAVSVVNKATGAEMLWSYLLSDVHPTQFLCLPVLLPEKPPSNFPEFRSFYHAALYAPTVFL